ncbi:MAG: DUF1800 domain-containing protein [Puia sp.]|nr:DUF1800 domain-containing protein [Puia sp.]
MNRTNFFVNGLSVSSGLKVYRGPWKTGQVSFLLKRTLFGASGEDVAWFQAKSLKKAVRELIYTEYPLPPPPVNGYNDDKYTDEEVPAGQTWTTSLTYNGMNNARRKNSFKSWWFGLMLNQDRSIREKMVLFWHNHFVTETNTVDNALFCYQYNDLLRRHALGNFREMVKEVTLSPAMLRYLNGYANTKKAPDENYGRELQELFTIGKGPGSRYTEADVKAAAKVLTGYTIDYKNFSSGFDPGRHDESDKQFSPFYGSRLIRGRKGKDGAMELDDLLDMLFSNEELSLFICRKIYRFFVYHAIDETTEKNVIVPLAAVFRKKNYEIRPVLETLFRSRHFFDPKNYGGMIKSPVDFTVGLCREFRVVFPDSTDYADQYNLWEQLRNQASSLQQNIGDPPNVAGWQAYYQEPEFDKLWISSDTLPRRNLFTDRMINNGFSRNGKKVSIDLLSFVSGLSHPEDPDALIRESVACLYQLALSDEACRFIKTSILLSGLVGMSADHYWTNAWLAYRDNPDDKANRNIVTVKLKALYKYLMDLPEYQLM